MQKELAYYNGLLTGFISNTILVEEVTELLGFIEEEPAAWKGLLESPEVHSLMEKQAYNNAIDVPEAVSMRMKERLLAAINETTIIPQQKAKVISIWKRVAAAAIIILLVSFGGYFIFRGKATKEVAQTSNVKTDIAAPVNNKATITLSNGRTILVDSLNSGILATQGNVKVIKNAEGGVAYQSITHGQVAAAQYNTLANPRGSKAISLTLSDGSQVWLNAESSLRYPASFTGNERKVEITGEAYFEITHNPSRPFIVSKDQMQVQVLGTHFNVNAYNDEESIKVTLLEGSVKITPPSPPAGGAKVVLKPGQQAIITQNSEIRTQNSVDLDEVMAWKNDLFHFESADVQTILRQFARWYDVEVVYEGTPNNKKFFGIVSRKSTLTEVLQLLKANNIKFRIEGKKLIVTST